MSDASLEELRERMRKINDDLDRLYAERERIAGKMHEIIAASKGVPALQDRP